FVDNSFMKELDSSGFIDRLYKTTAVAKVAPRTEPAPAPVAAKEKTPVVEAKTKAVATDEKAKPVAKQVSASVEKPQPTEALAKMAKVPAVAAQQYTVKSGDTLSRMAERFYNAPGKWDNVSDAYKVSR